MNLQWTEPALRDLQGIRDYIALDKPFYAARFIERIVNTVERLKDFPQIGRMVPEASRNDVRELIFQGYRIVYRSLSDRVQILTVVHGSRDLTRMDAKPGRWAKFIPQATPIVVQNTGDFCAVPTNYRVEVRRPPD